MRVALVTYSIGDSVEQNLAEMDRMAVEAASNDAHLVLFPEAAPTGLINNDDPRHDLPLGSPIPGPITDRWARIAEESHTHLASGLLEREGDCLYDSALLFGPEGEILLHYRRCQPQWHGRRADPGVYRQGSEVPVAVTPLGRLAFLICGDLFDDDTCQKAREQEPDLLLFPFARSFGDGSFDQERWDREELSAYATRAASVGATTLMVNALESSATTDHPSFGGTWVVAPGGDVIARHPLGQAGTLVVDL